MNKKILKNATWIVVGRITQSVLGLLVGMFTARYLGPSNFGMINYAAAIVAFVFPLAQLGLKDILVNEIIENPTKEGTVVGTGLVLSLFSSLICVIGIVIVSLVANNGLRERAIVCIIYSVSLLFRTQEIIQYWFQAKMLSKYHAMLSVGAYITVSIYKCFLLITKKSIYWFAASQAIDYMIISLGLIIVYIFIANQKMRVSVKMARKLLSMSKHYIIPAMMVNIYQQTDKIMLNLLSGDEYTGYYSAAFVCVGITGFVYMAIIDSVRPSILQYKKENSVKYANSLEKLYMVIFWLTIVHNVFFTVFARQIVFVLFGKEYYNSIIILRVLVWYTTFSYMGVIRNIWILAEKKQKYLVLINISSVVINVVLNYCLIPQFGVVGAAYATLITQCFANIMFPYMFKPYRQSVQIFIEGINPIKVKRILIEIRRCKENEK